MGQQVAQPFAGQGATAGQQRLQGGPQRGLLAAAGVDGGRHQRGIGGRVDGHQAQAHALHAVARAAGAAAQAGGVGVGHGGAAAVARDWREHQQIGSAAAQRGAGTRLLAGRKQAGADGRHGAVGHQGQVGVGGQLQQVTQAVEGQAGAHPHPGRTGTAGQRRDIQAPGHAVAAGAGQRPLLGAAGVLLGAQVLGRQQAAVEKIVALQAAVEQRLQQVDGAHRGPPALRPCSG